MKLALLALAFGVLYLASFVDEGSALDTRSTTAVGALVTCAMMSAKMGTSVEAYRGWGWAGDWSWRYGWGWPRHRRICYTRYNGRPRWCRLRRNRGLLGLNIGGGHHGGGGGLLFGDSGSSSSSSSGSDSWEY